MRGLGISINGRYRNAQISKGKQIFVGFKLTHLQGILDNVDSNRLAATAAFGCHLLEHVLVVPGGAHGRNISRDLFRHGGLRTRSREILRALVLKLKPIKTQQDVLASSNGS